MKKYFFTITILSLLFFVGCSQTDEQNQEEEYKTYTYSDHRYQVSFEYPSKFIAPKSNYHATGKIIQNEFQNDLGIDFIFMPVDMGVDKITYLCENNSDGEECEYVDDTDLIKIKKFDDVQGDKIDYEIAYLDFNIGKTYTLFTHLPNDASEETKKTIEYSMNSMEVKDIFNATSEWENYEFDEVLTIKHPPGTTINSTAYNTASITDPHAYTFTISLLTEDEESEESEKYEFWKDEYFNMKWATDPKTEKIDFFKIGNEAGDSEVIFLQATLYVDGLIYKIRSGPLEDVKYDDAIELSSEISKIQKIYPEINSNTNKYFKYLQKIIKLSEIYKKNVDIVKERYSIDVAEEENISNWATYKNEKHGFSFKYPKNMKFNDINSMSTNLGIDNVTMVGSLDKVNQVYGFGVQMYIVGKNYQAVADGVSGSDSTASPLQSREEIIVNDNNVIKLIKNIAIGGQGVYYVIDSDEDNVTFVLVGMYDDEFKEHEEIMKTFNLNNN